MNNAKQQRAVCVSYMILILYIRHFMPVTMCKTHDVFATVDVLHVEDIYIRWLSKLFVKRL